MNINQEVKQKANKLIQNMITNLSDFHEEYLDAQDDKHAPLDDLSDDPDEDQNDLSDYDSDVGGAFEQSDFGGFDDPDDESDYGDGMHTIGSDEGLYPPEEDDIEPDYNASAIDDDIMDMSKYQHQIQSDYQKLIKDDDINKLVESISGLESAILNTTMFDPNSLVEENKDDTNIPEPIEVVNLLKKLQKKLNN